MNLLLSLHARCCGQNANQYLTISELASKIKESNGLPGREIRKSNTIFRGFRTPRLPLLSNAANILEFVQRANSKHFLDQSKINVWRNLCSYDFHTFCNLQFETIVSFCIYVFPKVKRFHFVRMGK